MIERPRILVWFSRGVPSAVAAKLALEKYGHERTLIVYNDTSASEHPDGERFHAEIARWLGKEIITIKSLEYTDIDDVFHKTRYMSGVKGARCTVELKKRPRFAFQQPDDIHVFGFTFDELARSNDFAIANPELTIDPILESQHIRRATCFDILANAGIELPAMYKLGFKNNNCIGCVKGSSPDYWNKTRLLFPDIFEKRAQQSRELGVKLVRIRGIRTYLDDLPAENHEADPLEDLSCGPLCLPSPPNRP